MKKIELLLLLIFVTGLLLRIVPAISYSEPISYDSYFHIRVAQLIKDTGKIPDSIPWPEERPYLYPPLYHIILALLSSVTGISVLNVTRFFLPVVSSLLVLVSFFLVKKYSSEKVALFSAFFIAVNPYMISNSYDSPQMLGILCAFAFVYFFLEKKYLKSGLILAVIYLFSNLAAIMFSVASLVFLLKDKNFKPLPKIYLPAIITAGAWYLYKLSSWWCTNNSIAPYFLERSIGPIMFPEIAIISTMMIIFFSFPHKIEKPIEKFYFYLAAAAMAFFLSFFVTGGMFHPWRHTLYISLAMGILMPMLIFRMKNELDKKFLFSLISVAYLLAIFGFLFMGGMKPALGPGDYKMISWYDRQNFSGNLLAQHDTCSNLMTLTGKSCTLDTYFECIPNNSKWFDLENFYWVGDSNKAKQILDKYHIPNVMISSFNSESVMENITADKLYTAWNMKIKPYNPSSFYQIVGDCGC